MAEREGDGREDDEGGGQWYVNDGGTYIYTGGMGS